MWSLLLINLSLNKISQEFIGWADHLGENHTSQNRLQCIRGCLAFKKTLFLIPTAEFPQSVETIIIWSCQHLEHCFLSNIRIVSCTRQSWYIWIAAAGKKWKITSLWSNVTRQADWVSWAFSKILCGDPDQMELTGWRGFKQTASEFLQRYANCEAAVRHSWSYWLLWNFTRNLW